MGGIVSAVAGPVLGAVGGLIGGSKAADASRQQAEALRAAGERAAGMAQFKPMGMTTAFGTSAFTPEGQGSYTLSPQLRSLQQNLFGQLGAYDPSQLGQLAQPILGGAQSLFGLGGQLLPTDTSRMSSQQAQDLANQYRFAQQGLMPTAFQTGATPEAMAYANQLRGLSAQVTPTSYDPTAAAQQYYQQQQELMQPGRAAEEARLATANFGRGTGGLGIQTGTGTAPSNPLAQALFNAREQQNRTLAAQSTDIARQRLSEDIGLGTRLGAAGLTAQQQSEATQRANMLQSLGLGLEYGTAGLRAGEAGTQLARERFAEDLRLGTGLFGTGGELLGQVPRLTSAGYAPTETQLGLLKTTEAMGQDPFRLSQELAGRYSSAGAQAGNLYMQPQRAAADAYAQYQGYSPIASLLSGAGSAISPGGGASSWFSGLFGSGGGSSPAGAFNNAPGFNANYGGNYGVGTGGFE